MKRIGIYFFCVVALGCVTSSILYRRSEEANEIRLEKANSENEDISEVMEASEEGQQEKSQEEMIEVSDNYDGNERYFVKEEDGYLVIYDRLTLKRYDETTIQLSDLPERLQERVMEGLYFQDEEELYAFLENYSS